MSKDLKYSIYIILVAALCFIPFLGGVHLFDWDEINFAEISREMLLSNNYLKPSINFQPFWEKPPLFFWFQVLSMKIFGVNEFAARFPNAICGIITLLLVFSIGKKLYNQKFALIWVMVFFGSILPFLYFKSGIIDPFFNLFIFLGLYYFILFYWEKSNHQNIKLKHNFWFYLMMSGVFIGLAMLTKGQAAFLIISLCLFVYWIYKKLKMYVSIPQFLFFTFIALAVAFTWFGLETIKNGSWFMKRFIVYQYELLSQPIAGHSGFVGYHFVVLLFGCFPASVFAIRSFFKMPKYEFEYQNDFVRWMKYLFWVVLILFSLVSTKIIHYSSLSYFPLTFLAARSIHHIINQNISFNKWLKAGIIILSSLLILAISITVFGVYHIEKIIAFFDDVDIKATLEADVNWSLWVLLPALFLSLTISIFFFFIKKKKTFSAFQILFGGTAIFTFLTIIFFVGRVEAYSQRAAIDFFQSKVGEDCYITTHGYKSYAHYFYGEVKPNQPKESYNNHWLIYGDNDKTVYISAKKHKAHELEQKPGYLKIGSKNGFVFFEKKSNQ